MPFRRVRQAAPLVAETGTESAKGVSRAHDERESEFMGGFAGLLDVGRRVRLDGLHSYLVQFLDEEVTVLRVHDRLDRSSKHLNFVPVKDAVLVQLHAAVKGGLNTEREENALRLLLGDDLLHEERSDRQEVDLVGHSLGGLHCGDVRIDQDCLDALLAQGLQSL